MIFAACVMLLCHALPVFGWDEAGHKITAYIAWQQMTPAARERAVKLLLAAPEDSHIASYYMSYGSQSQEVRKRDFFVLISTWADIIKDRSFTNRYKRYNQSNWHYSDTFWMWQDGKPEIVDSGTETGKALEKIVEFVGVVRGTAPDAEKAVALAWLTHLIGDIHQPLHAAARVTAGNEKGDQGGNLFLLTPKGTPRAEQDNLHRLWDGIIERSTPNENNLCDMAYLMPIADGIMRQHPAAAFRDRMKIDSVSAWQRESFDLATTEAYRGIQFWEPPSDRYKAKALKIAEEQLALAGYRMGEVFNRAFSAEGK